MKFVAAFQNNIRGFITFSQKTSKSYVYIKGELKSKLKGLKGFHIHEYGDISDGCKTCGSHFDTKNNQHGDLNDKNSHTGDLGNILFNEKGVCKINIKTNKLTLYGKNSILGRSLVIHAKKDDLGKYDNKESKTTGNSGKRVDCCVIGLSK